MSGKKTGRTVLKNKSIVLDAWAILAWLQGEPEGKLIRDLIARVEQHEEASGTSEKPEKQASPPLELIMNEINLGEVFYIVGRRKGETTAQAIISRIHTGPFQLISPDWNMIQNASRWKMEYSVSFADAFAVTTAHDRNAQLATGDPELKAIPEIDRIWLPDEVPNG